MTTFHLFPEVRKDSQFAKPVKEINSDADVAIFNASVACDRILAFILLLNESVKGKTCLDQDIHRSQNTEGILGLLDVFESWIEAIPPSTGPRRFGNVAFRQWIARLEEVWTWKKAADCKEGPGLLYNYMPQDCHPALVEITPYLLGAFGSGQRLDYGTGHELSFAAFLCTLFLLRVLDPAQDAVAAALVIFPKYNFHSPQLT